MNKESKQSFVYIPIKVEDELPTDNDFHFCSCDYSENGVLKPIIQVSVYNDKTGKWACEGTYLLVTHWFKKVKGKFSYHPDFGFIISETDILKTISELNEETIRLHQVAEFWQQKYNETTVGWKSPKIDNNPLA